MNKNLLIAISIVTIGALVYVAFQTGAIHTEVSGLNTTLTGTAILSSPGLLSSTITAPGTTNSTVLTLQNYLDKTGYRVPASSMFDIPTQIGVALFQANNNIPLSGLVDTATEAFINGGSALVLPLTSPINLEAAHNQFNALVAEKKSHISIPGILPPTRGTDKFVYVECWSLGSSGGLDGEGWIDLDNPELTVWVSNSYYMVIGDVDGGLAMCWEKPGAHEVSVNPVPVPVGAYKNITGSLPLTATPITLPTDTSSVPAP